MTRMSTSAGLIGLLLLGGCGPAPKTTSKLQGSVTFDGAPVTDASIQLQNSETGEAFSAKLDDDGQFVIDKVTVGEYQASINPTVQEASGIIEGNAPPPKPAERPDIPARYRQAATSGFTLEVTPGVNVFDAEMTSEK